MLVQKTGGNNQMPFPKTWIEELALEWLHLQGFASQSNLPIVTAYVGGRFEADIVGARVRKATLEIMHIEVGQLAGGESSIQSVKKKFSTEIAEAINELFKTMFSFEGSKITHQKLYIATFSTGPVVRAISTLGIEVQTVPQFILERVFPDINTWKGAPPHRPRTKGIHITLPESYWLLQMLDHLDRKGLMKRI
jgi:hypothetical protein